MSLLEMKKEAYTHDKTSIVDFSIFLVNSKLPNVVSVIRDTSGEETLNLNYEAHILDVITNDAKACNDSSIPMISHDNIVAVKHDVLSTLKARTPILVMCPNEFHIAFSDSSITLASQEEVQDFIGKALQRNVRITAPLQWLHEYGEWSINVHAY